MHVHQKTCNDWIHVVSVQHYHLMFLASLLDERVGFKVHKDQVVVGALQIAQQCPLSDLVHSEN